MRGDDDNMTADGSTTLMPPPDAASHLIRHIADHSPVVTVLAAASDFRVLYANKAACHAAPGACDPAGRIVTDVFRFADPSLLTTQTQAQAQAVPVTGATSTTWWDVTYTALDAPAPGAVLITATDVTHHETAKEAAATEAATVIGETEARLRAVLLQIPAAMFIVEAPDGRVTFKSRLLDEVLGHPDPDMDRARATLRGWAVHKDGRPFDLADYPSRRALFKGETVRAEPMAFWRGDGKLIELEMYAGPVRNGSGDIVAAVAVAMDVTERRMTEERLRLVLDSSGLGAWEYDAVGQRTIRSARHDEIFGYPAPVDAWGLDTLASHIGERDRDELLAQCRAALDHGTTLDMECQMVRADGSPGWLHIRAKAHPGPDGRIVRLFGTVADISERRQEEAAFAETAAKFETFAQTMPSMVWASLPDGQIEWFNARVPEYCGIPADQMKPNGWAPVHPDDVGPATAAWQDALATGKPFVTEYRIRRHDGMFRWHLTRAIPLRDATGAITRWIGTSADIEDQKSTEQALANLNATLEQQVQQRTAELMAAEATLRQSQKMEAVGQLTGGLAHDFNNLLTGVIGSLDLLLVRIAQGRTSELDRYVHVAQQAARRAAALTHRLLAFSRRQTLDPKPVDMNQLVQGMDELLRRTVGPAVTVAVAATEDLWPVLADPNQLENALLNLCLNARDAMPNGGSLTIQTGNQTLQGPDARALDLQPGPYAVLSVSDTGIGMSEDVIARAFDPFFTTKPIGEGTGLGLSMVYGFVRQSGGQARIDSQPGQGTKISLYLPRHDGAEKMFEPQPGAEQARRGEGETVLVVDDEESVRDLVTEVLEELGYTVLAAGTGASGLHILNSGRRVDVLVTDVGLPGGMNGRQLADAALVTRPDLKILFITGYAEHAVLGQGHLKSGMHILTKPFSLETLGQKVREIVAPE
jgi:PAS domain S-box-containing protein